MVGTPVGSWSGGAARARVPPDILARLSHPMQAAVTADIAALQAGKPTRKLKDRAPGEKRDNGFWIDEGAEIEQQR